MAVVSNLSILWKTLMLNIHWNWCWNIAQRWLFKSSMAIKTLQHLPIFHVTLGYNENRGISYDGLLRTCPPSCSSHPGSNFAADRDPDSKVHGANKGPTWDLSAPYGPHVGPMNLAIRGGTGRAHPGITGNISSRESISPPLLTLCPLGDLPEDLADGKSTLVQIMAWCSWVRRHYLRQCWHRFMSPYGIIRPQ